MLFWLSYMRRILGPCGSFESIWGKLWVLRPHFENSFFQTSFFVYYRPSLPIWYLLRLCLFFIVPYFLSPSIFVFAISCLTFFSILRLISKFSLMILVSVTISSLKSVSRYIVPRDSYFSDLSFLVFSLSSYIIKLLWIRDSKNWQDKIRVSPYSV